MFEKQAFADAKKVIAEMEQKIKVAKAKAKIVDKTNKKEKK